MLNGADGLNEAVASIASQGAVVLRSVLGGLADVRQTPRGQAPDDNPPTPELES